MKVKTRKEYIVGNLTTVDREEALRAEARIKQCGGIKNLKKLQKLAKEALEPYRDHMVRYMELNSLAKGLSDIERGWYYGDEKKVMEELTKLDTLLTAAGKGPAARKEEKND